MMVCSQSNQSSVRSEREILRSNACSCRQTGCCNLCFLLSMWAFTAYVPRALPLACTCARIEHRLQTRVSAKYNPHLLISDMMHKKSSVGRCRGSASALPTAADENHHKRATAAALFRC